MINTKSIVERFKRYVECGSESGNERDMCLLLEKELLELGFHVERDEVGQKCGSNGWNIYARMDVGSGEPILFCGHMDTVAPGNGIEPVVRDGVIKSSGSTVLGADDKSAMAAVLEAVSAIKAQGKDPKRPIEILFTICEEIGTLGAKFADYSRIKSKQGLVLDAGNVGMIINKTAAFYFLTVNITGKAAHAGLSPELGIHALKAAADAISSIRVGHVDDISVMNIGNFLSPGRTNVVAESASFDMEIRSYSEERVYEHLDGVKQKINKACEQYGAECKMEGFMHIGVCDVDEDSQIMQEVLSALEKMEIKPDIRSSFGASDAARLYGNGIEAINIGTGMSMVHSTDEFITVDELVKTSELILNLFQ